MILFKFVGGEFVDPMVPESVVEFKYDIVAKNLFDAVDKFYEIFPSCVVLEYSSQYI